MNISLCRVIKLILFDPKWTFPTTYGRIMRYFICFQSLSTLLLPLLLFLLMFCSLCWHQRQQTPRKNTNNGNSDTPPLASSSADIKLHRAVNNQLPSSASGQTPAKRSKRPAAAHILQHHRRQSAPLHQQQS